MDSIDLFNDYNEDDDARAGLNDEGNFGEDPGASANENEEAKEVNAKIKVVKVKRKLQTLNAEKLKGPRGIIAVEDFFQNMKFKGKGYEKQDLNEVMKRLEHWAHRMYPKYNFDDSLTAIERLGRKKEVTVHMVRYRMDQLTKDDEEKILSDDDENDRNNEQLNDDVPMDEFEALIDEQIALTTVHSRSNNTSARDQSFDNLLSMSSASQFNHNVSSSTQISQAAPSQSTQQPLATQQIEKKPDISDEVRARIADNKRRALEILEKRKAEAKKEAEEKARVQESELLSEPINVISNILIDDDDGF